jgi:2-keto-4-pentenoate hydratase
MDIASERVKVTVNGAVEVERVASNAAGTDLLRLVEWLVNVGSVSYGGVKAGDWITTGSWTGKTLCPGGVDVMAKFSTAGSVKLRFT